MMQTWYGPVEDDTLRYSERIGFLAPSFEDAAELAHRYYKPILLGIAQRYAGHENVKEFPIHIVEYTANITPIRSDNWHHTPDIEEVAGRLIDSNPGVQTILLERGPDVREFAWSHEDGIRSRFTHGEIGVLSSRA